MKVSGGLTEDGVVIGNTFDKYGTKNPIARKLMRGFDQTLSELVDKSRPESIHEVGCGEGFWVLRWHEQGMQVRGTDFSSKIIDMAIQNANKKGISDTLFEQLSVYDLKADRDQADLVVCCEVMEHLDNPEAALEALQGIVKGHLIVSVPREPIWRVLNLARGKYITELGNTPGHLQHWSTKKFVGLVSRFFQVEEIRTPLPWTMLLCRAKI
ncbi:MULTISPECIES: class I SAM-dependent methyltransferase [Halomonadaceae]|uniref:Methyltransferase domain-containing protein n=1 Tax=Vreelandella halophila TaxID=86177 RepID=A0A9X5B2V7_9GAMM|nr:MULTISPECIES: class I SAM-dependent methyltransferase [Halomonas]MYL25271.1 methyltransferase domain-containing protein [Halomonas utahensis]MYL75333.1 methyltransferase domain-containing protein [Halomonas sp. 22501_18_FS]